MQIRKHLMHCNSQNGVLWKGIWRIGRCCGRHALVADQKDMPIARIVADVVEILCAKHAARRMTAKFAI
jgi:hypothetical protein